MNTTKYSNILLNKKILMLIISLFYIQQIIFAHNNITYTKADSIKIVSLLHDGLSQPKGTNLMYYYGMRLCGTPYVAHTLEVNKSEKLVINTRQLDCLTFIETVFALSLTTHQGSKAWKDFCKWLETIRYRDGRIDGYVSRNHYFLWWVESNIKQSLVSLPMQELLNSNKSKLYPYDAVQTIDINYMSSHPESYKMMKGKPQVIKEISVLEKSSKGKQMVYIPASMTGYSQKQLSYINTGDILAIATKKKGLDTSHVGIAVWDTDGKLHLLNASSIHKKVVLESMTLKQYMKKHPSQLGIWVIRPSLK